MFFGFFSGILYLYGSQGIPLERTR